MLFLKIYVIAGAIAVALAVWSSPEDGEDANFCLFIFCCNPVFYALHLAAICRWVYLRLKRHD